MIDRYPLTPEESDRWDQLDSQLEHAMQQLGDTPAGMFAVACAERALFMYEDVYPGDRRLRSLVAAVAVDRESVRTNAGTSTLTIAATEARDAARAALDECTPPGIGWLGDRDDLVHQLHLYAAWCAASMVHALTEHGAYEVAFLASYLASHAQSAWTALNQVVANGDPRLCVAALLDELDWQLRWLQHVQNSRGGQ